MLRRWGMMAVVEKTSEHNRRWARDVTALIVEPLHRGAISLHGRERLE